MTQLQLPIMNLSKTNTPKRVKTTKRNYVWTVQRKVGNRWTTITDSSGIITIKTRDLARSISREYNNTAKVKRSYRVKKLA